MYDWVTTTTVDNTEEFTHIFYVYVYDTYREYDDTFYNKKDN